MASFLETFGLNASYFYHFGLFVVLFFVLRKMYFGPFLRLFELRREKTIEDRKAAEQLVQQADEKLKQYQEKMKSARALAKKEYEVQMAKAKEEEARSSREQAKR